MSIVESNRIQSLQTGPELHMALLRSIPVTSGYITKRGGTSFGIDAWKSWKRRFFVLHGPTLAYYVSPSDAHCKHPDHDYMYALTANRQLSAPLPKPKGNYCLEGARIETAITRHPKLTSDHTLMLTTQEVCETLIFDNGDELQRWYIAIQNIIQSMSEFAGRFSCTPAQIQQWPNYVHHLNESNNPSARHEDTTLSVSTNDTDRLPTTNTRNKLDNSVNHNATSLDDSPVGTRQTLSNSNSVHVQSSESHHDTFVGDIPVVHASST